MKPFRFLKEGYTKKLQHWVLGITYEKSYSIMNLGVKHTLTFWLFKRYKAFCWIKK